MRDDTSLYVALDHSFHHGSKRKVAAMALAVGRREAAEYRMNGWQVLRPDDYSAEFLVDAVRKVTPTITELEQHNAKLLASLKWLVNLAHGVGKAGGSPESGEFEEAMSEAECVIEDVEMQPDPQECPLCGRTDQHIHHFD